MVEMSKKRARIFFIMSMVILLISVSVLAVGDQMTLKLLFDEFSDWLAMGMSSLYLIAVYSYGFDKRVFSQRWQLTILLVSAPVIGFMSLAAEFYEYWGYLSIGYMVFTTIFTVSVYSYVTAIIHSLRKEQY